VIAVLDENGYRRPERFPPADPGDDIRMILLYFHSSAASVPALTAAQFSIDQFLLQRNAGRKPFQRADQSLSVGLSGGKKS
jgi:hypothetical protein